MANQYIISLIESGNKLAIARFGSLSTADLNRRITTWLDWMDENFNDQLSSMEGIINLFLNRRYAMPDALEIDFEDEDYLHDAKLVNAAMGKEYYPIHE